MHWPVADTGRAINATTSTGREQAGREKEKLKSALENGTEAGTTEAGLDWTAAVE